MMGLMAAFCLPQVKATVQNGDLMHAADMLCSISFDRDDEFFATAGVSRRIKVYSSQLWPPLPAHPPSGGACAAGPALPIFA